MSGLTHFDTGGRPRMVDLSTKAETDRCAAARGKVLMHSSTLQLLLRGDCGKGDVARIAELAGIMAAKQTGNLIPLCHPLALTAVQVTVDPDPVLCAVIVNAEVRTSGRTGVEMEALTAVSVACLAVYDMLKAVDRAMVIMEIELLAKTGGRSGPWRR